MSRPKALAGVVLWTACGALAQVAAPLGNPLDALPRAAPPDATRQDVRTDVPAPPTGRNQRLDTRLTPRGFEVEGVQSIPFDEVADLLAPLTGQSITLQALLDRVDAATALYQRRGYVLSFFYVPEQDFQSGTVRVTAVEGHVQDVVIEGDAGPARAPLLAFARRIQQDKPLRSETFEHQVRLMGQLPGLTIQAQVQPPTRTDGASALHIGVQRKPYDVTLGLETRKPHTRGLLTGTWNDPWLPGSEIGASVLLSDARDDRYQAAHYQQYVGSQGWSVKGAVSRYQGDPDQPLGAQETLTRQSTLRKAELSAGLPLKLSRTANWLLNVGLYGVDASDTLRNPDNGASLTESTRTRVVYGQVTYFQREAEQEQHLKLTLSRGLDGLGAQANLQSTLLAAPVPSALDLAFGRIQIEARQVNTWGRQWGLAFALAAQYSPHRLPASEKISFGGSHFARGYAPGQAAGDSGWGLGLEIHKTFQADGPWLRQWQPYLLLESARVYGNQTTPQPARLRSASLGLRLSDRRHYSLDLAVSRPMGDPVPENPSRDWRASLQFSYRLGD